MGKSPIVVDHPLVQHKLALLRDRNTPDPLFRQLVREIALLLAYEVTRDLPLTTRQIETPLAALDAATLPEPRPALISILRAGNPLVAGLLEVMPFAAVGHVGMYREHETLEAIEYYFKVPADLARRQVIVADPMLATGNTAVAAVARLKNAGASDIRFLCLLAAPEGVAALTAAHPELAIYTAAIDDHLDENGYIVPGLGDAGDRIYGTP